MIRIYRPIKKKYKGLFLEAQINIINNINNNKSNIYDLKQLASTSAMFIYYFLNQIIPVRYIKKLVYLR